jgi:hypothetical protein
MKAKVGDFLVVKGTTTERHDQHAEIIEVRSQDGSPPYVVRWLVTDHEAMVYPGCDAVVVTATEHTQAGRAGVRIMTLDPTAALSLYDEAWAISDYESRLVSLRTFWADDGLYVDPDVPEGVRGPEALATEIERQLKLYPGMSIVSSAADVLGDRAWFRWSATLGTGESFTGVDFVEFAPDGRIARLTGFYEP